MSVSAPPVRVAAPEVDPRIRARRRAVRRAAGRRRLRRLVVGMVAVALVGLSWAALRSPLFDVDHVVVGGATRTGADVVAAASGVERGHAMVDVDAGPAARAVRALPWVLDVRVRRDWPGTVRIEVTERRPAVALAAADGSWVTADAEGRALETSPARPPGLVAIGGLVPPPPGATLEAEGHGALELAARLPDSVGARTDAVLVDADQLWLRLVNGAMVRLGDRRDLGAKLVAAEAVLATADPAPGATLDVRVPTAPSLTGG